MRRLFTTAEAYERGITASELRWGERTGRWRRIERGVYADGPAEPTTMERAMGAVLLTGGVACGHLAGVLHDLDNVTFDSRLPYLTLPPGRGCRRRGARERTLPPERVSLVAGLRCTDGLQTLLDLAETLDDRRWEHALESTLRHGTIFATSLAAQLPAMSQARTPGTTRVRRILELRPSGAAATESLLETLMVQLARGVPGLNDPIRQLEIFDPHGQFVARIDLSWPDIGLFIELDGEHHARQPRYDARRETAIVAATGWLCGRFTWTEVTRLPVTTGRRLADLARQARLRPLPCTPLARPRGSKLHETS